MVVREYVECPTCGRLYQIKIQVDQCIHYYEWPISFECQDCGEILDYGFSPKGLRPKESDYQPNPTAPPITTLGYSSSLPITGVLYLKDLDYMQSMALFSPFMSLTSQGHFTIAEIESFEAFLDVLYKNVIPYRGLFNSLLPIFLKGNVNAFSKKLSSLFDLKNYKPLNNSREMCKTIFELVTTSYFNLIPSRYEEHYYRKYIKPLLDYLEKAPDVDVRLIKDKLDESGKISVWYKTRALPYIAKMLLDVHKFIPVIIFLSVGENDIKKRGDLKIVTISFDDVVEKYEKGYEVFASGLKVFVGLSNIMENGDIDTFTNPGLGGITGITSFTSLSVGKMLEHVNNNVTIVDYLDGAMNNKVRNASSHDSMTYDSSTQEVHCYYNPSDYTNEYVTTLLDICRLCYVQMLHIIEATLLARKIVERVSS